MKQIHIFTALFWAIVIIETFYPFGSFVANWFGSFGTFCGQIICVCGLFCTALSLCKPFERLMR